MINPTSMKVPKVVKSDSNIKKEGVVPNKLDAKINEIFNL